jgi:hypothetical protein
MFNAVKPLSIVSERTEKINNDCRKKLWENYLF